MPAQKFSLSQSARIVFSMGWSDFVMKYHGSFLGYLWSFIIPLTKFVVILYVFRSFIGAEIPHYSLYLFLGIILWEYFSGCTSSCVSMLIAKESIVQKVVFPRVLLILAAGWKSTIIFTTHFIIFLSITLLKGVLPTIAYLYLLILIPLLLLFSLGIGMFLSAYSLKFRDIPHLWEIMLQVFFWLTPVFYPYAIDTPLSQQATHILSRVDSLFGWEIIGVFIRLQPLSILLYDFRRILLYPEYGVPSPAHLIGIGLFCGIIFVVGASVFQKRSRYFVQEYSL